MQFKTENIHLGATDALGITGPSQIKGVFPRPTHYNSSRFSASPVSVSLILGHVFNRDHPFLFLSVRLPAILITTPLHSHYQNFIP